MSGGWRNLARFMAGGPTPSARLAHIPALDGLRGVAVAAVLCFHGELGFAHGGFLGVSTFFTLSGFLITSLLLIEWESTSAISLRRFWTRRARRLLPAALLALVGIAAYAAYVATGDEAGRIGGDGLGALFYVANWRFVLGHQSYAALFSAPSPVQHFWSLAIEEQFYLLFPLFAVGLLPRLRSRRRFQLALIALAGISAALAWLLWSPGQDPSRVYYGTDTRAVEILIGGVLATMIGGRRASRVRVRRIAIAGAGMIAAVALGALWATSTQTDAFLYRGGLPLNAALTAVVIAGACHAGPLQRGLQWRPLRRLGVVSYGAYLYHWPIFLWLSAARVGFGGLALFGLRVSVTMAAALLSYRFLESPIRTGRRVTSWRPRVLAPVGFATVGALLFAVPGSGGGPQIVFAALNQAGTSGATALRAPRRLALPTTTNSVMAQAIAAAAHDAATTAVGAEPPTGATLPVTGPTPAILVPPPVLRIMVVGDSVAQTMGRGLERWGPGHGIEVLNAGRLWCGIARGGRTGTTFGQRATACEDWATRWTELATTFHPDVVVVLTTVWDASVRQRDEWGPDYIGPGDPRFDAFITSEWSESVRVLRATGARVAWLVPPCALDPASDMGIKYAKVHYLAGVVAAGAVPIDLAHRVCPNGKFRNELDGVDGIRPDGLHFSDPGADLVAAWLGPQLANPRLGMSVASPRSSSGRVRRG